MSLVVPTHVARQVRAQKVRQIEAPAENDNSRHAAAADALANQNAKDVAQDIDTAIPEGLPEPEQWRVTLMPVRQVSQTKGGIWLPGDSIITQNWTHQLWKVCKVGPFVYRGPAWQGFSDEELEAVKKRLVPGALYLVDPKAPRRYRYKGILFIVVNDDQLWSHVDSKCIDGLEFQGLEL